MNENNPQLPPAPQGGYQQPQYVPVGQGYALPLQKGPASGLRVAAGTVAIPLGLYEFTEFSKAEVVGRMTEIAGFTFLAFLFLATALGIVTCGIILLARSRIRGRVVPIIGAAFAGLAILLGVADWVYIDYDFSVVLVTCTLAVPVLILLGLALAKEKRAP